MEDLKNLSAEAVMAPFVGRDTLTNRELFQQLALQLDIPEAALEARAPVGKAGKAYNLFERKVRWHQQTLKHLGVLERVERDAAEIDKVRAELAQALGLPANSSVRSIRAAAESQSYRLSKDGEIQELRHALSMAQRALTGGLSVPALATDGGQTA